MFFYDSASEITHILAAISRVEYSVWRRPHNSVNTQRGGSLEALLEAASTVTFWGCGLVVSLWCLYNERQRLVPWALAETLSLLPRGAGPGESCRKCKQSPSIQLRSTSIDWAPTVCKPTSLTSSLSHFPACGRHLGFPLLQMRKLRASGEIGQGPSALFRSTVGRTSQAGNPCSEDRGTGRQVPVYGGGGCMIPLV